MIAVQYERGHRDLAELGSEVGRQVDGGACHRVLKDERALVRRAFPQAEHVGTLSMIGPKGALAGGESSVRGLRVSRSPSVASQPKNTRMFRNWCAAEDHLTTDRKVPDKGAGPVWRRCSPDCVD
jgi:hypothetical protein